MFNSPLKFSILFIAATAGLMWYGLESPIPWVVWFVIFFYGVAVGPLSAIEPWKIKKNFDWAQRFLPRWLGGAFAVLGVATLMLLMICCSGKLIIDYYNLVWLVGGASFGFVWAFMPATAVKLACKILESFFPAPNKDGQCLTQLKHENLSVPHQISGSIFRPPRFLLASYFTGTRG